MPRDPEDMDDLDRPATKRDLLALAADINRSFATKDDLKAFATKDDLKTFATKDDLKAFAMKDDLKTFATKDDLKAFPTKDDLKAYPTRDEIKEELKAYATKADLDARFEELRRHFDMTAERFETQFNNLFDWTSASTSSLGRRVTDLETNHGGRLLNLETRVTRIEKRRK
jgi:hypothetical protein